jgi:hypothetical protein
MGEEQIELKEIDFKSPYYPLAKEDSILGAADESFVAWNLYITLQNSIQFADYKINLLFFIAGLILSMVINSTSDFLAEPLIFQICYIIFLVVTVPFVYYSIKTIAAQTFSKPDVKSKKLYFFIEIASMPTSEYIKRFRSYTRKEHYDELLLQIHNLSKIARGKFQTYSNALYLLCIMMAMLVVMLVIKAFAAVIVQNPG